MADSFRMRLTPHRETALDRAKETFDENARSKAVVLACEHSRLDAKAKERALEAVADDVDLSTLARLADLLSTRTMAVDVDIGIQASPDDGREVAVDVTARRPDRD